MFLSKSYSLTRSLFHPRTQQLLGDLIAIVGQVGSGKSSILGGLLGAYVDFINDIEAMHFYFDT